MANQNRAQASRQARASALDQLNGLGSSRGNFETADMFTAAESSVADFIERVKDNIQSADIVVTGKIEDIKLEVSDTGIKVLGHKHLLFVDKGVNGSEQKLYDTPFSYKDKMPPASAFIDYIKEKNLQLRNEENYHNGNPHPNKTSPHEDIDGDEQAIKSAAYAMSRKIFKEGFKGTPIFSKEIPQLVKDLKKTITNFSKNMITSGIRGGESGDVYKRANP
jgi:hypothetical protein